MTNRFALFCAHVGGSMLTHMCLFGPFLTLFKMFCVSLNVLVCSPGGYIYPMLRTTTLFDALSSIGRKEGRKETNKPKTKQNKTKPQPVNDSSSEPAFNLHITLHCCSWDLLYGRMNTQGENGKMDIFTPPALLLLTHWRKYLQESGFLIIILELQSWKGSSSCRLPTWVRALGFSLPLILPSNSVRYVSLRESSWPKVTQWPSWLCGIWTWVAMVLAWHQSS